MSRIRIFRGSGIFQALCLMLFLLILSSCEHKEFRYVTSSFRSLRVEFNWERYEDFQKPEGMRVIFFPKDGTGEPWIFDFPNGEGRQIELPETSIAASATTTIRAASIGRIPTASWSILPRPAAYWRPTAPKPAPLPPGSVATTSTGYRWRIFQKARRR